LENTARKTFFPGNVKKPRRTQGLFKTLEKTQGLHEKTQNPRSDQKTIDLVRKPKEWQRWSLILSLLLVAAQGYRRE